jgi:gliding motility-associated-like protein
VNLFKRIGLTLIFAASILSAAGQVNIVVNPSFEQYIGSCSSAGLDVNCASTTINGWDGPTLGSPDWYNNCQAPMWGVPQNQIGYQFPHSGNSYTGIAMVINPYDAQEYIEGMFSSSLIANKKYCVAFFVSLADSAWYGTNAMGAYISVNQVCSVNTIDTLPYIPQIKNPSGNPLTDKIDWVAISGEYNAAGGEKFITIGSFDSGTAKYFFTGAGASGSNVYGQSYYYIDDVSVREIIQAHAGSGKDTVLCTGHKILIGQDTTIPGISYKWSPTNGLSNPNAAQTFASPTVTTTYTLTAVNDSMKGCNCPDSISKDSITVIVDNFFGTACCSEAIASGQSVLLNSTPAYRFLWTPSTGLNCDTCQSVSASPANSTIYYVTLSDSLGCIVRDSLTVTVKENCGNIFIPNAFSPNGDGQNDVLLAKDNCVKTFYMAIYDRWGNKVFDCSDINTGWNGVYRGKPEEAGTYVYYANGIYTDGSIFNKKGNITLVR